LGIRGWGQQFGETNTKRKDLKGAPKTKDFPELARNHRKGPCVAQEIGVQMEKRLDAIRGFRGEGVRQKEKRESLENVLQGGGRFPTTEERKGLKKKG